MSAEPMLEAIEAFFALLRTPLENQDQRLETLAQLLDRIAIAIHVYPPGEVSEDRESRPKPPPSRYPEFSSAAVKAFPELGLYPYVDQLGDMSQERSLCDSIDDIADIACDLSNFLWLRENVGEADAAWELHFSYKIHWGSHLHNLRAYLHAVMFRS